MDSVSKSDSLQLEDAVETGFFLLPKLPGELAALAIPGVQGRVTPISSPFANVVGAARLDDESADSTVTAVVQQFADAGLSFGWRVGPCSTPDNLGNRLLAAGMERLDNILGLSCDNLAVKPAAQLGLTIRKAGPADLDLLIDLLKDAFSYHAVWAPILARAYMEPQAQATGRIAVYLAFTDDGPDPVGFGSVYYLPDRPVAMLSGAGVRKPYRRHGIYSSLIGHRLLVAHKNGAAAAVIQAVPESAAGCEKWGFVKFCELEHYIMEQP